MDGPSGSRRPGQECQEILKILMQNEGIDVLKKEAVESLTTSADMRRRVEQLVQHSAALKRHRDEGARDKHRKQLFDSLKRELEEELIEQAQAGLWAALTQGPLSQRVDALVHEALCLAAERRQQAQLASYQQQQQQQQQAEPTEGQLQIVIPQFSQH